MYHIFFIHLSVNGHLGCRNRDADTEDGLVDVVGEGEGGMNWESTMCNIDS